MINYKKETPESQKAYHEYEIHCKQKKITDIGYLDFLAGFNASLETITQEKIDSIASPIPIDSFSGIYRFLSNFYPAQIDLDNITYPSVEHAYQAAKTQDPKERETIKQSTAGIAKKLGKKLTLRPDWDQLKLTIMENLLIQKFNHPHLKTLLLDTKNQPLIEGNYWGDRYWGVCQGTGENHLGKLLMKIRDQLNSHQP